jgi:hypothetical protein
VEWSGVGTRGKGEGVIGVRSGVERVGTSGSAMRCDTSGERSGVEWAHVAKSECETVGPATSSHCDNIVIDGTERECVCVCVCVCGVTWRTLAVTEYRERLVALLRYAINPLRCGGVHEGRLPAPSQVSLSSLVVLGDGEERRGEVT